MKKVVAVIVAMLVLHIVIQAQAPQGINYQAVARDASGSVLDGVSGTVRISILDSIGGNVLYQEEHSVTTNQFGLFNVVIGQGTALQNAFSTINWSLGKKYLEVEADFGNGYENMGTTQLVSVPYALYAETSGDGPPGKNSVIRVDTIAPGLACTYGGVRVLYGLDDNGNGLLDNPEVDGSRDICRLSPSLGGGGIDTVFIANDSLYVIDASGNVAASSISDSDWQVSLNSVYNLTQNVGIGTSMPAKKLHIETTTTTGVGDGILIDNIGQGNPGISFKTQGTPRFVLGIDQNDGNKFKIGTSTITTNTRFVIDVNGNIGIGTVSPLHKLDLMGGLSDTIVAAFGGSNPFATGVKIHTNTTTASSALLFTNMNPDTAVISLDPNKRFVIANLMPYGAIDMGADTLYINGEKTIGMRAEKMGISADTLLIFGRNSAYTQSWLQGAFHTDSLYLYDNGFWNSGWLLASDGSGKAVWTDPAMLGLGSLWFQSTNGTDIYFSPGNVGIGTSTPAAKLEIKKDYAGIADALYLSNSTNGNGAGTRIAFRSQFISTPWTQAEISAFSANSMAQGVLTFRVMNDRANNNIIEVMRLTGDGNVGMGTISPTATLHLNGSLRLENLSATPPNPGDVLTAINANGDAEWKPRQVAFEVYLSTLPAPIPSADSILIPFDATSFNDANAFNTVTSEFVAPVDGVYHFDFNAEVSISGTWPITGVTTIKLLKNGVKIKDNDYQAATSVVNLSINLQLAAGETVAFEIVNNTTGTINLSIIDTWFSGHLLYAY